MRLVEQVGRSLGNVRLVPRGATVVASYMVRERVVMTAQQIASYQALAPELLVRSMHIEAQLMKRFADEVDYYAATHFDPPVFARYIEGVARAHSVSR